MNETSKDGALSEMGQLIRASGSDWARAMVRQAWLGAIFLIVTYVIQRALESRNFHTGFVAPITALALAFAFFADAMRTVDPSYKLQGKRLLRLFGISVSTHLITLFAALVPTAIAILVFHNRTLAFICVTPVLVFFDARFCFAWFLSGRAEDAVAGSWSLTSGVTLVATIVPAAIAWLPTILVLYFADHFSRPYGRFEPEQQIGAITILMVFVRNAWIYPLIAHWLSVCTRLHRSVEERFRSETVNET